MVRVPNHIRFPKGMFSHTLYPASHYELLLYHAGVLFVTCHEINRVSHRLLDYKVKYNSNYTHAIPDILLYLYA